MKAKPATRAAKTETDLRRLQHELEVHQIELEMQNEELRAAQAKTADDLEHFTDLYDFAPVGYVSLCAEGTILRLNLLGATLAGLERGRLVGRRFGLFLAEADRGVFSDFLERVLTSEVKESCEVRLSHEGTVPRVLQIEGTQSPDGQECRAVLLDITERKQAEAALSASEAGLRLSVAVSNIGLWDWNLVTNEVYFSKEWKRQLGYAEDEIASRFDEWESRVHPEDLAPTLAKVHAFIAHSEVGYAVEFRLRHKDGSYRWIYTQAQILRDATQKPLRMIGCHLDITERKRVEVEMDHLRRRYALILDAIAEGVHGIDLQGRITFENAAAEKLLGWRSDELLGKPAHSTMHHSHADGSPYPVENCPIYATLRDGVSRHVSEEVFWRKDGTSIPVEYSTAPKRAANGTITGAVVTFSDITERKRAEDDLRLQVAALNSAANEVVITDRQGIIQWVNPAFTKTTGYTLEEAVGQNPRILKSGKHDLAFYQKFWATLLRGEVFRGEMVNRRKDGSLFTEEAIITPVKDEHGAITHFIAIKQDITEKKLLAAKFLRAQRLEGLGALAGGVAHDLNNVLAPILMASELLKSQATDPPTRKLLEMIQTNSERGAGMIRQILAFARGSAGEKIAMQVGHLLKEMSKLMQQTFPPNIQCELRVASGLELVLGETTELYQVLLNLCVNARDAMPKGGTITLGAENIVLDETYARLSHEAPPGHYVVIMVADTGGGIPKEIQAKIFDPFFTTKEPGKGTGLGLATVKDIVAGHKGFIHLYSEVGVGTQFKIYLPVAQGEEAAAQTAFLTLPGGHGELVLLVDDEAAVREIVKATLENYGYRVVTANDGTEGVARFFEHSKEVQLLLTDIQMPLMDGMALIRALRNVQPGLKVIAASGLSTHEAALKATGISVQAFIVKPFTAASLLLALDTALHPK